MRTTTLAVLAASLLTASCIRIEQSVTLQSSGATSIFIHYSVSRRAAEQMNAMNQLGRALLKANGEVDSAPDAGLALIFEPSEEALRAKFAEYKSAGVVLTDLRVENRDTWRHVYLTILIDDLVAASQTDLFPYFGFSLLKTQSGNYVFGRAGNIAGGSGDVDFSDPETIKTLSPLLAGLKYSLTVNTPGKIIETNAPQKSNISATWDIDFDKDLDTFAGFQNKNLTLVFEGKGLEFPTVRQSR